MQEKQVFGTYLNLLFNQIPDKKKKQLEKELIKNTVIKDKNNPNNQKKTQLHDLLTQKLNNEEMEQLSQNLIKVKKIYKLDSYKPQSDDQTILALLEKKESYFEGKYLQLDDPKGNESIFNEILLCQRYQENKDTFLQFCLDNGSYLELKYNSESIQEVYTSYIKKIKLYELFQYIESKDQILNGTIEFWQQKEIFVDDKLKIKPGIYQLKCNEIIQQEYVEYSLNALNNPLTYKFKLHYTNDLFSKSDKIIKKIVFLEKKNSNKVKIEINEYQLNTIICNYREEKKQIQSLNSSNVIENIHIKEMQLNENKQKFKYLEEISICKDNILKFLKEEENQELLKELLNNLVLNNVEFKSKNVASNTFQENLNKIQQLNSSLNIQESQESILQNAVIQAIYTNLIQKSKTLYVLIVMDTLKESFHHTKSINNMDLIMFLGGTGSGKSTSINYYLGHTLEEFEKYGRKFVKLSNEENFDPEEFAKIGQSVAVSETTYIHGYKVNDRENLMLCDCPGFDDMRGEIYDLVNSLSIDQTIKNSNSIKAIVLTLSYESFFVNRSRAVIDLFENLQKLIPDIFMDNQIKKSIYLLITKYNNQDELSNNLAILINDIQKTDKNILDQLEQDKQNQDNYQQQKMIERLNIWKFVQQLISNKQILSYSISNQIDSDDHIARIFESPSIQKQYFCRAMNRQDIQTTFSKYILLQIDTWQTHIFEKYLKKIPKEITEVENQITSTKLNIYQKEQEKTNYSEQILHKQTQIGQMDSQIKRLQQLLQNNDAETSIIEQEYCSQFSDNLLRDVEDELKNLQIENQKNQKIQNDTQTQIDSCSQSIEKINNDIVKLEEEQQKLSKGNTIRLLYEEKQLGADDDLQYSVNDFNQNNQQRKEAFNNVSDYKPNGKIQKVKAGQYSGILNSFIYINQEYYIVPKEAFRMDWKKMYNKDYFCNELKYKAIIECSGWEFDLGIKAHPDRKKIIYSIKRYWSAGQTIPWFKIYHDLPNSDINEARDITELQKKQEDTQKLIEEKFQQQNQIEKKIEEIKKQQRIQRIQHMNENIIYVQQLINDSKNEIQQLNKYIDINKNSIISEEKTINKKKTDLLDLKQKQLHYAIIINCKKDIAHLLKEFAGISLDGLCVEEKNIDENFVPQLKSYQEYYDNNMKNIESLCKQTFIDYRDQFIKQQQ